MARDHFPPLVSHTISSRSYPNPPSPPTPTALFISSSQQYPWVREIERERERGRKNGCIHVINFRPSTQASRRHHPGRIDHHLLCHPLSRIWEAGEKGRYRGLARPFSTGRTIKLLDYPAFYFHEFRRTSAQNHNQPLPILPASLSRLLWIVSRESNDRDEADEMERPLCWITDSIYILLPKVSWNRWNINRLSFAKRYSASNIIILYITKAYTITTFM